MQLIFSIPNARQKIEKKIKRFTIREPWSNGKGIPKIGEILYLKDGRRFVKSGMPGCLKPILIDGDNPVCTGVWPVKLHKNKANRFCVNTDFFKDLTKVKCDTIVEGLSDLDDIYLNEFAIMDGWQNFEQMIKFFKPRLPLKANIIYWGKI